MRFVPRELLELGSKIKSIFGGISFDTFGGYMCVYKTNIT